jgi:hypothetical protein
MKRILAAFLLIASSHAFADVEQKDKVFITETDNNKLVYMIAPSVQIKKTSNGIYYITGDSEIVDRSTGKGYTLNVSAPLLTCANGRGMTVISNTSAIADGTPADKATQQFYWEKQGTKTADAIITVLCLVAEKMVEETIEAPKKTPKSSMSL